MSIHIGRLIEERIKEVGMTKAEFGRRINTSRQNVNTLLRKESLDTVLLDKICKVLDYDFFRHFVRPEPSPPASSSGLKPRVSVVIELSDPQQHQILKMVLGKNHQEILGNL